MHEHGQRFMRLFVANQNRVYGLILSLVPNWADADDIMQETSSVMWSKFDEFEPGTDFTAWALRIARYQVMAHLKTKRKQRARLSTETLEAIADRMSDAAMELDDRTAALNECIAKLNDRDQKIMRMRYEQGGSTRTVAERIDRSVDAVYKALNRIHHSLLICIRRTMAKMEGRS